MKSALLFILFMAGTNSAFCQLPEDSIRSIIKEAVASKRSKSIIIGIIDSGGRKFFSEGIISDQNPNQPDSNTLFEIGSITKIFTALALADMSLKHQLNLNDPISKFLPKTVKTPSRNGKEISLLSLASHTSTFPRFPYNIDPKDQDDAFNDYTKEKLYEYISHFQPDIDIDAKWRYSNTAYGLLGGILTSVSRQKNYELMIIEKICKPLSMSSTVISLTPSLKENTAIGHTEYGQPVPFLNLGALEGAGAFRSNVNDLLTFAAANLGFIKSDLMPAMELSHQKQIKKESSGIDYATMGWTLWDSEGRTILFKDGGTPGYRTFLGIDKQKKFGVVVLSNSNNGVTDIGTHILDPRSKIAPYKYNWKLLDTLRDITLNHGTDSAIKAYEQIKSNQDAQFSFDENQLNVLGNELRRDNRINEAIKIFELNERAHPKQPVVFESLGEIYKRHGNRQKARAYFEKARALDPGNPHWNFILSRL